MAEQEPIAGVVRGDMLLDAEIMPEMWTVAYRDRQELGRRRRGWMLNIDQPDELHPTEAEAAEAAEAWSKEIDCPDELAIVRVAFAFQGEVIKRKQPRRSRA